MEVMKKERAATQYIYTENDETFDSCDDLSKDEDTDSDTQSSDIDADELNRQFSNIGSVDISEVLIPDYVNSPPPVKDTEEILYGISSHWGKQYFLDHYPIIDRTKSDENCLFSRNFIRLTIKSIEPKLRELDARNRISEFSKYEEKSLIYLIDYCGWIENDMIDELLTYINGIESDVLCKPVIIISRFSKTIIWPEILAALLIKKLNFDNIEAVKCTVTQQLPK